MSKKIIFVLLCSPWLLQSSQDQRVKNLDQVRQVIKEEKEKSALYNRRQNYHIGASRSKLPADKGTEIKPTKEKK